MNVSAESLKQPASHVISLRQRWMTYPPSGDVSVSHRQDERLQRWHKRLEKLFARQAY